MRVDIFTEEKMKKGTKLFYKVEDKAMGSIKDRNSMDLTEAEDIKKRWQKIHRSTVQKRSSLPR